MIDLDMFERNQIDELRVFITKLSGFQNQFYHYELTAFLI